MSVRKLLWETSKQRDIMLASETNTKNTQKKEKKKKKNDNTSKLTKEQTIEHNKIKHNNHIQHDKLETQTWSSLLPRHLDPEPILAVVRTYSPDDDGMFLGLKVLIFCDGVFYLCKFKNTFMLFPLFHCFFNCYPFLSLFF